MGNLLTSFNAGVSGIHSAQASLNTTSHNLANAQTKGYTRQQVLVTDSSYQSTFGTYGNQLQVGMGTVVAKTRQIRNDFLDEQYREQLGRAAFYNANLDASLEIEDMLGELYGEQFSTSVDDLWTALQNLAESPGNIVHRDELVSRAAQFIERAEVLYNQLNEYQTSLNQEVINQVDRINELVAEVDKLNDKVKRYEALGDSANDYRDKRNDCLDELAQIIHIEVSEEVDGTVFIYSEGGYLLDAASQYPLTTAFESESSRLLKPVWAGGGDFFVRSSLRYSSEMKTDVGSLRGLMVARGNYAADYTDVPARPQEEDFEEEEEYIMAMNRFEQELEVYNDSIGASVVMQTQTQFGMLVHAIVTAVNDVLSPLKEVTLSDGSTIRILDEENALIGDDINETMGAELFSRRAVERYTRETVDLEDGDTVEVWRYNEEDAGEPYSMYSIQQLCVNPVVQKDPSAIPTKYNKASGGYEGFAHDKWIEMADSVHAAVGVTDPNSTTTYNVFEYYNQMVGELGVLGNVWSGVVTNQETTVTMIDNERQNVMGVSTDEELSDLIKFQQCYNASARYITTVAEMIEYLIEKLGG